MVGLELTVSTALSCSAYDETIRPQHFGDVDNKVILSATIIIIRVISYSPRLPNG